MGTINILFSSIKLKTTKFIKLTLFLPLCNMNGSFGVKKIVMTSGEGVEIWPRLRIIYLA